MAKRVRLSDDGGSTWHTLPGNSADFNHNAEDLDDTIFGQNYTSGQTGMIGWTVSANALYKGFAGYVATIKKTGTATASTGESMTNTSGKEYQIDAATKQIWDRSAGVTVYDGASPVNDADIESIDYLFGKVTFAAGYTVSGAVTVDISYLGTSTLGCANGFTLSQTAQMIDNTCMDTAAGNSGHRTFEAGLKSASLDLNGIYKASNGLLDELINRNELIIEINPDGSNDAVMRGFFKCMSHGQSGNVGELETETVTFSLSVPDDDKLDAPLKWEIAAGATVNQAVQVALNSWLNGTAIDMQYLPDGSTGKEGSCLISDVSLTGGLEAMNEFTANLQGSGQVTDVV